MGQLHGSFNRKYLIGLLILGIYSLTAARSEAVSLYWNPTTGGQGYWDTTSTIWSTSEVAPDAVWDNG